MKVCGIIAEYDPFHKGHLYQLEQAKALSGADYTICVLGCAFSQRGDAMLFDSHARAEMALRNGFDLALGMPFSFSCAQSNRFAAGGVGILNSLGVVSHLSFGSESDQLDELYRTADMLNHPGETFLNALKAALHRGRSFAAAQGEALEAALPDIPPALFSSPNFILGVSYLRELEHLGSSIKPVPVRRQSAYHSLEKTGLASASAVRAMIAQGEEAALMDACPQASLDILRNSPRHPPGALDRALMVNLLNRTAASLARMPEVSEGLERRILAAARQATGRAELVCQCKTRRYPAPRINRALTHALVGLTDYPPRPPYARLLGFRERAKPLLKAIATSGFPLVSRPARSTAAGILQDMRAEELWQVGSGHWAQEAWKRQMLIIRDPEEAKEHEGCGKSM